MSRVLTADVMGNKGMSLRAFAEKSGISIGCLQKYCREGKVFGARRHPLTKAWWIYPPAKLLCQPRSVSRANTSTGKNSISLDDVPA